MNLRKPWDALILANIYAASTHALSRLEDQMLRDQAFTANAPSSFRNPLADGTLECDHPPLRGFANLNEAFSSLMPYHVWYENSDCVEEDEFDRALEDRCQHLLSKFDGMKSKYQALLLKESTVSVSEHFVTLTLSARNNPACKDHSQLQRFP
jgi:hypothetical protein